MVEFEYKDGRRKTMGSAYAKVLEKAGYGHIVRVDPATYVTRDLKADKAGESEEISPRTGKPKRKYKRRDMRAED